jgi:hypothetical protein
MEETFLRAWLPFYLPIFPAVEHRGSGDIIILSALTARLKKKFCVRLVAGCCCISLYRA